ncbi:hypothetical protein L6164_022196 [Bauhinia variegata]|uniref:Uncharacterized protein n=1 Tax=Bauhinia variegata TaxID=167791 RepID=A0ACB9MEX0_BAUVA|nr:hypothetical protein L6164_022196 [Bauhinia variegata]
MSFVSDSHFRQPNRDIHPRVLHCFSESNPWKRSFRQIYYNFHSIFHGRSPKPSCCDRSEAVATRGLSHPISEESFFLGLQHDQLERTQARAVRSAAIRRKSIAGNLQSQCANANSDPCLNKQQILELFHNCIKLASENKINQKNTWELNLIDHLTDVIKAEEENDVETNFQKVGRAKRECCGAQFLLLDLYGIYFGLNNLMRTIEGPLNFKLLLRSR